MAVVIKDRICRQCGCTFPGGPRAWYCPNCRLDRQREANRRIKKNGAMRPLGSTDYCTVCGKIYVVNSGHQKYCPACAPDAIRAIDLIQSTAWNAQFATPEYRRALREKRKEVRRCPICGTEFMPMDASITCSRECSVELRRARNRDYEAQHRKEINARKAEQHRKKLEAMTPEELAEYREKRNAAARENYKRRKEKEKKG